MAESTIGVAYNNKSFGYFTEGEGRALGKVAQASTMSTEQVDRAEHREELGKALRSACPNSFFCGAS